MIAFNDLVDTLKLEVLVAPKKSSFTVPGSEINRPGLQLTGFWEYFAFNRPQIIGRVEATYLRSLTPGEMLGQVIAANSYAKAQDPDRRVHNIVLMGSGEPLDNYDNVMKFLRLVNAPEGLNISLRNISLSTCGLVPKMYELAEEDLPVTLSVSLHAPNDSIRRQTMPVANAYPMDQLLEACRNYIAKTGRRVIFEYALVADLNCEEKHADELSRKLRGMQCHVNLIPLNSVKERNLEAPSRQLAEDFQKRLTHNHISATIRREMGSDIDGACGQLRRKVLAAENSAE